jgi:uncharacterized protein
MSFLSLILASLLGWFISSLVGGGSSFILMPFIGIFLGAAAIAPVVTIGGILGSSGRAVFYREKINWTVLKWDIPGAIFGAVLGAFALTKIHVDGLKILIGLFLLLSALNSFFKPIDINFKVKPWHFLPASFIYGFLSGLLGSMGPLLVPFYLNYGLEKEELLGTQATTRVIIHFVKIITYGLLGLLTLPYIGYGILVGLAAFPGNFLGHIFLEKLSQNRFQQLVISFVMFSGIFILWEERNILLFWH